MQFIFESCINVSHWVIWVFKLRNSNANTVATNISIFNYHARQN